MKRVQVLTHLQIEQKINRIAHEIYEYNFEETEIVIAGIAERGFVLAHRLAAVIEKISPLKTILLELKLDKKNLRNAITFNVSKELLDKKVVFLVDDVLNTGQTMAYAFKELLNFEVRKIATVVLVDRNHNLFPVKADYVGLSMATTLQEHVSVEFGKDGDAAYLS